MNITDNLITYKQPTRRDRWGRYLVVPPTGGKPIGYTRATTVAKTLDDSGGLLGWGKRMVAIGLGRRPDLVQLIAATDPNDKKALDEACERAAEAGGSTVRRDQGIALHAALETSWHDPETAPGIFLEDVRAVHRALEAVGLRPVLDLAERIVVNDRYQIAGTFDLVLTDGDNHYVADVKTGSSLLGSLAWSAQLAIYAGADALYSQGAAADGSEDLREEMPELDRSAGVILHVQPGSAVCDLHWIDLEVGAEALQLAVDVRAIRKSKPLTKIEDKVASEDTVERLKAAFPGAEEVVGEAWRGWFRERLVDIIEAGHGESLSAAWPYGIPTLKSGDHITISQADELEVVVAAIEKMFELPFPQPKPGTAKVSNPVEWVSRIGQRDAKIDEGHEVSEEEARRVNAEVKALGEAERAFVSDTLKAASAAGLNIRMTGKGGQMSQRRLSICELLVDLAGRSQAEREAILALANDGFAIDDLGRAFGAMTLGEADNVHELIASITAGRLAPVVALDGTVNLERADAA